MANYKYRNIALLFIIGIITFSIVFIASLVMGTQAINVKEAILALFNAGEIKSKTIIYSIRLPRSLSAIICGAGLSVSGYLLQVALKNSLSSPGILGLNTGAGFFVLLASLFFPYLTITKSLFAFIGSITAISIVYLISINAGFSKSSLILAGVAISSLMTAGIDILITLYPEIVTDKISFNLGGFANLSIFQLKLSYPIIIIGIVFALFLSNGLDILVLGDDTAYGLGLNVKIHRIITVLTAALIASACVSISGLLSFVGLIIPNLIRIINIGKSKTNIFLCLLFGSTFLLLCDMLAHYMFFPYEIPVGLFLSCLGSPFFIFLIIQKKR